FFSVSRPPPSSTHFPYTTLFRSTAATAAARLRPPALPRLAVRGVLLGVVGVGLGARVGGCGLLAVLAGLGLASRVLAAATAAAAAATTTARAGLLGVLPLGGVGPLGVGLVL